MEGPSPRKGLKRRRNKVDAFVRDALAPNCLPDPFPATPSSSLRLDKGADKPRVSMRQPHASMGLKRGDQHAKHASFT